MRGFDHRITTCAPAPVPPHVAAAQVRDIQTNVTYIRETIVSIKPDDVTLDLSPLYDAERQAADAVDVVEVWSGDARDILQGLKASFVIFGVCAIALALFGIAVLWRRVRPAVTPHISTHHTAVQPCLGQSCACRSVLLWRHTPTTPAAPQTTTFGAVQTRSLLYLFFALAGAWTFIAWLLGTLGVTVRTFFRDLCDVLLLHVNGEQNAWILDTLRCRELRRGIRGLGTAMAAANAKIEDVNADIESAPLACGLQLSLGRGLALSRERHQCLAHVGLTTKQHRGPGCAGMRELRFVPPGTALAVPLSRSTGVAVCARAGHVWVGSAQQGAERSTKLTVSQSKELTLDT